MEADVLKNKFIDFFTDKDHKVLPSASLIPEDDPTILFTPAGMSPLVRYLMGQPHPLGKRLCSVQKCLRTDDISQVGDLTHFTFFEMLGNWSLGDYFKKKAINWSMEFIVSKNWLNFNPKKIYVTVFEGDKDAPKDIKSIKIWQSVFKKLGIDALEGDKKKTDFSKGERIFCYGKKENWWGPAGQTGPCGPSTEMFYDTGRPHNPKFGKYCHPNCNCGRFFEFWNDVFMEYKQKQDGSFSTLKQKNVDTGMGLERVVALTEYLKGKIKEPDPFLTSLFLKLVKTLEKQSGKKYQNNKKSFRTISDHLRAAVFIIAEGVRPSNKDRGYILRRLIRRAVDNLNFINIYDKDLFPKFLEDIISTYSSAYPEIKEVKKIKTVFQQEAGKYSKVMAKVEKLAAKKQLSSKEVFKLFTTYGVSPEQLKDRGYKFSVQQLKKEMNRHRQISKKGVKKKFSGGLQDHSPEVVKLHTATHLLHQALRLIMGKEVKQVGSNINKKRLRFDFTLSRALTDEEIKKAASLVNKQIDKNLKVSFEVVSLKEAKKQNALAFFGQRYPEKVKVYSIGDFSKEVCGGPHVDFTGKLGKFIIDKEESCGAGKRRIYASLK